MFEIEVKMKDGALIGSIEPIWDLRTGRTCKAALSSWKSKRRKFKTVDDAWTWLNESSGGQALPLTVGQRLGCMPYHGPGGFTLGSKAYLFDFNYFRGWTHLTERDYAYRVEDKGTIFCRAKEYNDPANHIPIHEAIADFDRQTGKPLEPSGVRGVLTFEQGIALVIHQMAMWGRRTWFYRVDRRLLRRLALENPYRVQRVLP